MFMDRQKYYFTIRFLQWLITYRGEGYELDQIQSMEQDINTWSTYMHDVDCILFGNQEWIPILMPEHLTNLKKASKQSPNKKKKEKEQHDSEEDGPKDQDDSGLAKI